MVVGPLLAAFQPKRAYYPCLGLGQGELVLMYMVTVLWRQRSLKWLSTRSYGTGRYLGRMS